MSEFSLTWWGVGDKHEVWTLSVDKLGRITHRNNCLKAGERGIRSSFLIAIHVHPWGKKEVSGGCTSLYIYSMLLN